MRGGGAVANVAEFEEPWEHACFELVDAPSGEGAGGDTSVAAGELASLFCTRRSASTFRASLRAVLVRFAVLHLRDDELTEEVDVLGAGRFIPCGRVKPLLSPACNILVGKRPCGR